VVALLVIVVFRSVGPIFMVLFGLLLGVVWLIGVGAAFHVRVNFLNFVVLPITFGIGVDYAVNIVQRYRIEGRGSLPRVIRETGSAVALCSCTTIIGYASLLVADNRALAGFGLLASLGELTCISAALFALPAWMIFREERTKPKTAA
jgi:predicted RND superfamily exporter protein